MNENGNGTTASFRAEIGMALVIDVSDYATAGALMDEIRASVERALTARKAHARFDFTHFNTHPCKAAVMRQSFYDEETVGPSPAIPGALLPF